LRVVLRRRRVSICEIEDIVDVVSFFAGREGGWINRQVNRVNGGDTLEEVYWLSREVSSMQTWTNSQPMQGDDSPRRDIVQ
jgi:hypothetical protein